MLKELKKQSIGRGLKAVFFFLFAAALAFVVGWKPFQDLRRETREFEDLKLEDLSKDINVNISLDENFGCYMEEYEEKRSTGARKTTALCYLVSMRDAETGEFRMVSLVVKPKDEKKMEAMAMNTYNGRTSDPITYKCSVKKMGTQERGYAEFFMKQMGLSDADIKDMLHPYHLICEDWDSMTNLVRYMYGGGMVCLFIAVVLLLYSLSGARMAKIKKEIKKSGYSWELVEADYENAKVLMDKPTFRVGRIFTFLYNGATPHIVLNKNIVFVYQDSVTQNGRYGLKKTTYLVGLKTIDKKVCVAEVTNEGKAQYILTMMNNMLPWVVTGSDNALHQMYQKNLQEFLNIRYNQVDDKTTSRMV